MTMTLAQALLSDEESAFELKDPNIEEGLRQARKELGKEKKRVRWGALGNSLKQAVFTALDVGLDDVMGEAWSGWEGLRKYADPEQTPPDDINVVPVTDHTIESRHSPVVDVVVRGRSVHSFPFDVLITLGVEGVNLVVQRGKIQEIRLSRLKVGGSVKLRDRVLLNQDLRTIDLPGSFRLPEPIPIRLTDLAEQAPGTAAPAQS